MVPNNSEFRKRLKAAFGDIRKGTLNGVRLACAHVKSEAQQKVPVNEGNLKGSADTDVNNGSGGVIGLIYFTANYAAAVHEKPMIHAGKKRKGRDAKGKYWDPQGAGTNKFLEKAIAENRDNILEIIKKSASL